MPAYMVPAGVSPRHGPLPRNPNGKLDRKSLAAEFLPAAVACAATTPLTADSP